MMENKGMFREESLAESFDVIDFLIYMMRRWKIFLLVMLIFCSLTVLFISKKENTYTSYASIFVQQDTQNVANLQDIQLGNALSDEFVELAKSKAVMNAVCKSVNEKLGCSLTRKDVVEATEISNTSNTRLLVFRVTHTDPQIAKETAEAMARITAKKVSDLTKTDKPSFVDHADIEDPNDKGMIKGVLLSLMAGFLLVMLILPIQYFTSDMIVSRDDVEKYLEENLLGVVSLDKAIRERSKHLKKENKARFKVKSKNMR